MTPPTTDSASAGTLAERVSGRSWTLSDPYQVARPALRDFAAAVGATHPMHHHLESARAAGHADLVAPPTFVVKVTQAADFLMLADPDLGIRLQNVVHGEQSFTHERPVVAGDELTATTEVTGAKMVGTTCMLQLSTRVLDAAEELVATGTSTLVIATATPEDSSTEGKDA
ncbi:MaoC family dehydratase N-terminal domain-containing protein [Kytococcus sedentarius]|uniref:FAS1-like dehydratase domain-containing protein n=1 Tax=Kytococcus sedentarius TaxID=1276 RepID=UPI0035BC8249